MMAVISLSFSPTADLFLLKGGPTITLSVNANVDSGPAQDVTPEVLSSLTPSPDSTLFTISGDQISSAAGGTTGDYLGVMSYVDGANTHYLIIRIRVRNSIQSIWIANNQITLPDTMQKPTVSVYAKFDDGSFGDVTSHPFLNFQSSDTSRVIVNQQGQLAAIFPGSSTITLTAPAIGAPPPSVVVTVPTAVTVRSVKRVWGSGSWAQGRNLLILAEGFTSTDAALFTQCITEIPQRLFHSKSHSPYNLVSDSWNVWAMFETSLERGVTVGAVVTTPDANGYVTQYDGSSSGSGQPRILQAKDSMYGLMYGGRPGDRPSMVRANPPQGTDWYHPWAPYRAFYSDPRRIPVLDFSYFRSLKNQDAAAGTADYEVGSTWSPFIAAVASSPGGAAQTGNVVTITTTSNHDLLTGMKILLKSIDEPGYNGIYIVESVPSTTTFTYTASVTGLPASGGGWVTGTDRGMVASLVNDDSYGGAEGGDLGFSASIGQGLQFHTTSQGDALDHDSSQSAVNLQLDPIIAVFAHEMAHALGLYDEYEGYDDAAHTTLANNAQEDKSIEAYGNVTVFDTLSPPPANQVQAGLIKWNWDRMAQSSRFSQDLPAPSNPTFDVVLDAGQGKNWGKAQSDGTDVYFRSRIADQRNANALALRQGPFQITNINADTVTLQGTTLGAPSVFQKGSVLYVPKKDSSGQIVTLIPGPVLNYVATNGAFPRPTSDCTVVKWDAENPPDISGFHYPRHHYELVGLYTGGGAWNCNVFRPAGWCKMRGASHWESHWRWWPPGHETVLVVPHFCFVCKYWIVDLIDAGKHATLDQEYPEDC